MKADLLCAYLAVECGQRGLARQYLKSALNVARERHLGRVVSRILLALKWLNKVED